MGRALVLVTVALLAVGTAQADVFHLGAGLTSLETVPVGDPGNAPDTRYFASGRGAIDHNYRIGKYEVTAAQYCDFLNHVAQSDPYGLYSLKMADLSESKKGCNIQRSGSPGSYSYTVAAEWANRPVNWVSFWSACRFVNWVCNGQGNGGTENGAYTLGGYTGADGHTIKRNARATWFIPSEDEWYKAAYYNGGETAAGYWIYPTQSDAAPSNEGRDDYIDPGNHANCVAGGWTIGSPYYRTNVGEFENSAGPYGTYDQAGNVFEWTEALITPGYGARVHYGGGFWGDTGWMRASERYGYGPCYGYDAGGFRIASIPEPSCAVALACWLFSFGAVGLRSRRAG